jgi:Leucine-rich repeat (LRR) protein
MSMSTEATGVPIDETTFPDPNLRKKISDDYDENGDGYLSDEERETACKIGFVTKSVANTQGLEYFYAMESLDCRGNNITLIDLTPFKKLKNIMFKRNYLTSLDLSQNTSLTSIECEQNLLTTLDFSECKSVHYIDCSENNIRGAGMDRLVYSLPTIKSGQGRLYVKYKGAEEQDNEMTKAQVLIAKSKGWTPLIILSRYSGIYGGIAESEEYEGVDDGTNVGFVIDAAHFPDAAFRAVVASTGVDRNQDGFLSDYERQQTSVLNLQGKGIRNLQGIEYYEEMQKLNCQDNELTELDLSNNKGIKGVYLYGNNICGEAMDRLIESLPNRPSSDKGALFVICDGKSPDNAMTNLQVEAAKAKGWNAFRSTNDGASWVFYAGEDVGFAIDEQHFPDENFRTYIQSTIDKDKNGYLSVSERQDVTSININSKGIARVKGIEYFPNLEWLNCITNQLTSLNLEYNRKLKVLNCRSNQLTYLNISQNELLEELNCSSNQLTQLVFENNPNLEKIYIHKNKVRGDNMTRLVNSLPTKSADSRVYLYVFDEEDENTGNYMTYSQMAMAMEKHWGIYRTTDGNWEWISISSLGVAIDEGNFPDEVFRDYVKQYDTDNNGALSTEERESVTEMDVNGNVADVTGIENFTALKTLEVDNQQLTELDVSKLTELETLRCYNNQLTTLDLTKNTKLIHFTCSDNQLETLNLAKNTALTDIWCSNNQLTKLDVANNTALVTLDCSDNQLTSLNVAKNTALADLRCYNNQLTTLDLSTNVNLEYLYCNNNRLTTILTAPGTPKEDFSCKNNCLKGRVMTDIVNNLPVVEGKAIYFRSMKDTEENEMTSAQVNIATGKGWKVRMDWYNDRLEDYEGYWVELAIDETNFPDAKFRNYVGRFIDKDGDGYLRDEERLSVKSLNISNNNIADLTGIKFFTNLEELDCSNNKIATFDLSENTALKSLNCSRNLLTRLLFGNEVLEEVDCSDNQIEKLSLWSPALKTVDCYNNKLKEEGSTAWFIDALPETEDGKLYFHYDGDENTISHQQVIAANKKGWKVFYNNDSSWHKYKAYVKGDADGDGVVDVNDVTTTINHILGKPVANFIEEAANVDGDDTIDVNDVQGIINIALGKAGD